MKKSTWNLFNLDYGYYLTTQTNECVQGTIGAAEVEDWIIDQCSDPANGMQYSVSKGYKFSTWEN